ncbi:cytosine permease [Leifsonia sp. NPDC058248]|uniref:cytosine permease n=1 Tax=Leifsonia sp. NPDC058248 TaxID=3346402 RepID=UPI0036DC4C17
MDSDEVANDPSVVSVPGKRRATYTPPVRRTPPAKPASVEPEPEPEPEPATDGTTHDDDELASALEAQVSRMTSAVPIIAGPTVVGADGLAEAASLTDDQVAALVDVDLSSHDTLAAIEHLERVLVARATMAIPIQRPAVVEEPVAEEPVAEDPAEEPVAEEEEPLVAEQPAAEERVDANVDADAARRRAEETWTGAISFDDLDLRRPDDGPEPTFSAWIAPAAQPGAPTEPATPLPAPDAARIDPSSAPDTPQRIEPLGFVPPEVAPTDSQPVPFVPLEPLPVEHPDAPSVDSVPLPLVQADQLAGHALVAGAFGPDAVDDDLVDDADDVRPPTGAAPMASPRVSTEERVLFDAEPEPAPLFEVEDADLEPTPVDRRVGHASRLFWLWFAGTSSLISVGVGATLLTLGLSLRQILVATLVGVALSFLPLGIGTLAGKWSGQPTMVVSRSTFGVRGNVVPAALALLTRLFWGVVLLWLAGAATGSLFVSQGWASDPTIPTTSALIVAFAAALAVAYYGYSLVARVQLVLTIASAVLIAVMIGATWNAIDMSKALAVPDGVWLRVVTGAVLVFSYLGLAWANSSAEVARYQRPGSSGGGAMLWATFGAALPPFVLISYGGMLAASNTSLAHDLAIDPVSAFAILGLPSWYPIPLLLSVTLSLISALVLNIYSGGFTLEALGVRLRRRWSTVAVGLAIAVAAFLLTTTDIDLEGVVTSVPITLAVPVGAWAGLFSAEMMLRTRRLHQPSLVKPGGIYPDWRWTNVGMLVVASVVGLGLIRSDLPWLAWEGFLFRLLGVDVNGDLGSTNIGVLVALGIGILTPIVAGVPAIRRQERAIG